MAITNNLTFTIQQLSSAGISTVLRTWVVSDAAATVGEFRSGTLIDTSETTISLPITQPRQIMVRNTHATAKITVKWTPFGGAEATITKLGPSASIALWDPTVAGTTIGISSLKLTSDTSNATYELYLGG